MSQFWKLYDGLQEKSQVMTKVIRLHLFGTMTRNVQNFMAKPPIVWTKVLE